ncbi:MAG: kelch repeat-containing protein [Promethearchaeota archaeon]
MEKKRKAIILVIIMVGSSLGVISVFYFLINTSSNPYNEFGWTWISGNHFPGAYGIYGTKGVPSLITCPGSREGAVSWTDSNDNLWLFGGAENQEYVYRRCGYLNDLWKFDGFYWTWMSGDNTANVSSVYGEKGIPDASNKPGGRRGSISWIDSDDNLWLFGGEGLNESGELAYLNDLWKFDGMNWTWISGNNTHDAHGVYGMKGVPDPLNYPGSRTDAVSWIDSDSNLWLYGGEGYSESGEAGYLRDLWKFDGENWTWVSGYAVGTDYGVYGTKGIPDPSNNPGSRTDAVSWIDSDDNLWLFGGGVDKYSIRDYPYKLNDLWKFDGGNWTWISGNDTLNQPGVFGTKFIPDSRNYPGSKYGAVSWTDSDDNFYLFGGFGSLTLNSASWNYDLWKFDGENWTWLSGGSEITGYRSYGIYGTKGVYSPGCRPGARVGAISWADSKNKLWLFGGEGFPAEGLLRMGYLNDLWKYDPDLVS